MMVSGDPGYALIMLVGAVHGINPAMGWLFAVSLGLQENSSRAVWRALTPLAVGHAFAIAAALLAAAALGVVLPLQWVRWITAVALLAFGVFNLVRHRHPRLAGMRVGAADLTIWSFLMASAHGAGLMLVPFLLGSAAENGLAMSSSMKAAPSMHHTTALGGVEATGLLIALVHTCSYLVVAGAIAFIVYRKLGLRLLRTAWINVDVIWAVALVTTAVFTLLL